jgi:hypothetical integral membrane protein (TIGR02206 family)
MVTRMGDNSFQAFGAAHLTIILLTIGLPFLLAAIVRRRDSKRAERIIAFCLGGLLLLNFIAYEIYVRRLAAVDWWQALPMQLCDWAMFVIIVAMWTGRRRWFEVAYFWGIGGTLQAIITPNLRYGFPDLRFVSFFVAHSVIIIGIVFVMLVKRYRPWPSSIVRTFVWTEVYFVVTFTVDLLTGVNYGFLLHKPEAFSLLSFLSDWRPLYLVQMHGLALLFYVILYLPFALWDIVRSGATRELPPTAHR